MQIINTKILNNISLVFNIIYCIKLSPLTSVSLLEISDSKADIKITHIGQLFELSLSLFEVNDRSVIGHNFSSGQI